MKTIDLLKEEQQQYMRLTQKFEEYKLKFKGNKRKKKDRIANRSGCFLMDKSEVSKGLPTDIKSLSRMLIKKKTRD